MAKLEIDQPGMTTYRAPDGYVFDTFLNSIILSISSPKSQKCKLPAKQRAEQN